MKFEYLREFEPEFEKVLGYALGAYMGSIHEINQRPKISCYCTFKEGNGEEDFVKDGRKINQEGRNRGEYLVKDGRKVVRRKVRGRRFWRGMGGKS